MENLFIRINNKPVFARKVAISILVIFSILLFCSFLLSSLDYSRDNFIVYNGEIIDEVTTVAVVTVSLLLCALFFLFVSVLRQLNSERYKSWGSTYFVMCCLSVAVSLFGVYPNAPWVVHVFSEKKNCSERFYIASTVRSSGKGCKLVVAVKVSGNYNKNICFDSDELGFYKIKPGDALVLNGEKTKFSFLYSTHSVISGAGLTGR